MATIKEIQEEIIDEFSLYDEWFDRYALLIEMGNTMEPLDERYKTDTYLIEGCQSRVWLHAEYRDGLIWFDAESDAVIVKGIVMLLVKVFSGQSPDAILASDTQFLDDIGLRENLSPTRSNGLLSMIKQMRLYALAFKSKEQV